MKSNTKSKSLVNFNKLFINVFLLLSVLSCVNQAVVHHSIEEARLERQRLVRQYIKTLNKEDGALRLVGGNTANEVVHQQERLERQHLVREHNKTLIKKDGNVEVVYQQERLENQQFVREDNKTLIKEIGGGLHLIDGNTENEEDHKQERLHLQHLVREHNKTLIKEDSALHFKDGNTESEVVHQEEQLEDQHSVREHNKTIIKEDGALLLIDGNTENEEVHHQDRLEKQHLVRDYNKTLIKEVDGDMENEVVHEEERLECQHLVREDNKTITKEEGNLRLVDGVQENEGFNSAVANQEEGVEHKPVVGKCNTFLNNKDGAERLVDGNSENEGVNSTVANQKEEVEHKPVVGKCNDCLNKKDGAIRLVGGNTENEGNIEVLHNNRWGSICDDEWDATEGKIVCEQLGFPGLRKVTHNGYFGPAKKRFWMDNLFCEGHEKEITQCHFDGWGTNDCEPSEAAGVICNPLADSDPTPKVIPEYYHPKSRINYDHRMDIRLRGGRVQNEGRVEVRINNGPWGTICSDGWSLLEANVVCRELNLGYAKEALQTDYFGGMDISQPIISGTECYGNETALRECLHHDYSRGAAACHGTRNHVAVVLCDHLSPDIVIDFFEIEQTAHVADVPLGSIQCAMEENCVASEAYEIQRDDPNWLYMTRRLLKFTTSALNMGNADFRPFKDKSTWEWHMCHMHYHSMEVFATFDIIDISGNKVAQGHKASFCLEDTNCLPGTAPKYDCDNFGDQGISVHCSDVYAYNLDCQWVDITDLDYGFYILKIALNPEFKVAEMSFDNNAAVCNLLYTDLYARVTDCRLQRP